MSKELKKVRPTIAEGMEEIKNFLMDPTTDNVELPVKHSFSPGIYARELAIPEGTLVVGKIHKHRHHNFLMQGSVLLLTEANGVELLQAPLTVVSEPGTQKIVYAITDAMWVNVHENKDNTEDIDIIESRTVTTNKEKYIEYRKSLVEKITI
jgi:hypothetical protein